VCLVLCNRKGKGLLYMLWRGGRQGKWEGNVAGCLYGDMFFKIKLNMGLLVYVKEPLIFSF
jgi:hypothetical protein